MKKIFIIIALLVGTYFVQAQESQVFFYGKNQNKIHLDRVENRKIIRFNETTNRLQRNSISDQLTTSGYAIVGITPFIYSVSARNVRTIESGILSAAKEIGDILYISDVLMYRDSTFQWSSNRIFVKIQPASDLHDILQKNEIPFMNFKQFSSDKQTYIVELDVTKNSAIDYANRLSGARSVVWAQPSFWRLARKHSSGSQQQHSNNNPLFPLQWGLENTGQHGGIPGIDINVIPAWNIATGAGIRVAVLDEGIDLTHPDLRNNLLPGYDATDAAFGGSHGGFGGGGMVADAHGTACAGIIAAVDNDIGIKGVAHNAKIIPIRIAYSIHCCGWDCFFIDYDWYSNTQRVQCFDLWFTNDKWIADGIRRAWDDYGADILNNSWGGGSESAIIITEINAAVTQGRNSLGSVVVFSSGNWDMNWIDFPANLSNVITVGAISPCGERKSFSSCDGERWWGSSFGEMLDVVAPGVLIPTTDIQGSIGYSTDDYFLRFNGTSAAAPHVAGVAALILSVNPNLTGQEVRDIIERTARRVNMFCPINNPNGYVYEDTQGRYNGTWNIEMGHGLVDAYAAVRAALATLLLGISGPDKVTSDYRLETFEIINLPAGATVSWSISDNMLVSSTTQNSIAVVVTQAVSACYCDVGTITATIAPLGSNPIIVTRDVMVGFPPNAWNISSARNQSTLPWGNCSFEDAISYRGFLINRGIPELAHIQRGEWSRDVFANNSGIEIVSTNPELEESHPIFGNACPSTFATLRLTSQIPSSSTVGVRLQNRCGWSDWTPITYFVGQQCVGGGIWFPWNINAHQPTIHELHIEFLELSDTEQVETYTITLSDNFGNIHRRTQFRHRERDGRANSVRLNTSGLQPGVYHLHIEGAGQAMTKQVIVR